MKRAGKKIIETPNKLVRGVSYHVDDATTLKSSNELAIKNPILKKQRSNNPTNNSFQHPTIGRITCDKTGCRTKVCDKPCGTIIFNPKYFLRYELRDIRQFISLKTCDPLKCPFKSDFANIYKSLIDHFKGDKGELSLDEIYSFVRANGWVPS